MTALRIAADLALPLDAVTQAIAILARRGAGKTYTAAVLVEEVISAGAPVVVLDPTGAWWGLRSSADGRRPGLSVVILGGEHGDVPLERTAGKVIADVVIDHPGAYVVDMSGFESNAAQDDFAADFLERLYRAKAQQRDALLLVVDEADSFAPQRPGPRQLRMLGALEAIVRRGRIRGLGAVLISQRAAVLNKNVLTQCEVLVALQTTGPQDRAAIDDWIKGNGTPEEREEVMGSLAGLSRGEAWVWSPSWLRILQRVRIRKRRTFDSSATPEAGSVAIAPTARAAVDLTQLGKRIADTVEQSKANDPAELRKRIRALEAESAARLGVIERRPEPEVRVERIEIPVLNGQVGDLRLAIGELVNAGQRLVEVATAVGDAAAVIQATGESITAAIDRVTATPTRGQEERAPRGVPVPSREAPRTGGGRGDPAVATLAPPASSRTPAPAFDGPVSLGKADRLILATLAQHPEGLSRVQIALLSGYTHKSSTIRNALGALRTAGFITKSGEPILATEEGVAAAGDVELLPPAGPDLVAYWRSRLGQAERAILDVLVDAYPSDVSRQEIAERTSYTDGSSTIRNALGRLRSLALVEGWHASQNLVGR